MVVITYEIARLHMAHSHGKSKPHFKRLGITATVFSPSLEEIVRNRMRMAPQFKKGTG